MKRFIECCNYWGPMACTLFALVIIGSLANVIGVIWGLLS